MFLRKSSQSPPPGNTRHGFITCLRRDRGFSILEVLIGMSLFMVGLLGVTALQISSLKSSSFAGNLSEATTMAASRIEEIMSWKFDDPRLTDKQTSGNDGHGWDGPNGGQDKIGALADDNETGLGRNNMYSIFMNISESDPMSGAKRINIIVYWEIKEVPRQISIPFTLMKKI